MKCPDCSEYITEEVSYCPFCGYQLKIEDIIDKDSMIKALEQKIAKIEQKPNHNGNELVNLRNEIRFMRSQLDSNIGKNKGNQRYCIYCFLFIIFWSFIIPLIIYRPWYW